MRNFNHLSWDDIRIFLACIKQPSFRQAAEELNTSYSTVVRRIDQLEKALGVRLFDRLPDGIVPTHDAQMIKESARRMEHSLLEILHKRVQSDQELSGEVKISITEGLGSYWLMPRLVEFQQRFPNIVFNVQCAMKSADVLRLEADIAIHFEPPTSPNLFMAKLGTMHIYPFAAKSYLEMFGAPKSIDELDQHYFVHQVASPLDKKKTGEKCRD